MTPEPKLVAIKDGRVAAIAIIWGTATGMLALCIPMLAIVRSAIVLPFVVVIMAGLATMTIWRNSHAQVLTHWQLEDRVQNLEAICTKIES